MKILFYYTSNQRTVSIESVILGFKAQGHEVILLTQTKKYHLHEELEKNGVKTYTHEIKKNFSLFYYLKHFFYLKRFLRQHKPDIVYSHLQQANIVAVFAQRSSNARFYICRHHTMSSGGNESRFDRIINKRARTIIVPSLKVYNHLVENEKVDPKKLKLIYYGYDFSKYEKPNAQNIASIREQYAAKLLLVKIARLVPGKRYMLLFETLRQLVIEEKYDIRLLVISEGPQFDEFQQYIKQHALENHIFLLGNKNNIIDYLSAADAVPLISESEASNNVIKEAGLVQKTVLVCRNVGDFNDYITHLESGILLDEHSPTADLKKYLVALYQKTLDTQKMGENLHTRVIDTFSIEQVIKDYAALNLPNTAPA